MAEANVGASHLCEMVRQVRASTLELLLGAPEGCLLWTPEGTSNHLLWHAGHALWLQDRLCVEPLTGRSELPAGWEAVFGMNCLPVASRRRWPARGQLADLLGRQLERMLDALVRTPLEGLAIPAALGGSSRTVAGRIVHGLHDEARHQGEMVLLLKLARARRQVDR